MTNNELPKDFDEEPWEDDEFDEFEEGCPMAAILDAVMSAPKPLGMIWDDDMIDKFLKHKGYKIITRKNSCSGEDYHMAIKNDNPIIPDDESTNVLEVFNREIQETLINWLIKIS